MDACSSSQTHSSMVRSKFKDEHPFGEAQASPVFSEHGSRFFIDKRKAEAERIRQKYPDRIPVRDSSKTYREKLIRLQVICEKAEKSDIPTIDKKKYLVPAVRTTSAPVSSCTDQSRRT